MSTKRSFDASASEQSMIWSPVPWTSIKQSLASSSLDSQQQHALINTAESLRGPMKIQGDGRGNDWLVYHQEVFPVFEKLYKKLEIIPADFDLSTVYLHIGLLQLSFLQDLKTDDLDPKLLDAPERQLIKATSHHYSIENASVPAQWMMAVIIHTIDFIHGLEGLSPPCEAAAVLPFLKLSTTVFRKQCGDSTVLDAMSQLWATGGHPKARKGLLDELKMLNKRTGNSGRKTRLRRLPLKSERKLSAAKELAEACEGLSKKRRAKPSRSRSESKGRKMRRRPRASARMKQRQLQRRKRMRSQRLATWSASTVEPLQEAVKGDLMAYLDRKSKQKQSSKPAKTKSKAPSTVPPKVKTKRVSEHEMLKLRAARKAREKQAKKLRDGQRKRRSNKRGSMRSARMMAWSASAQHVKLGEAEKQRLRRKAKDKQELIVTPPALEPVKKADKPKKKRSKSQPKKGAGQDRGRSKARKRRRKNNRSKSRSLVAMKSQRLAAWSVSQNLNALPASHREMLAQAISKPSSKSKDKSKDKRSSSESSRSKVKRSKGRRGKKGRRSAGKRQAGRAKARRQGRSLQRKSQKLVAFSASQELQALPDKDKERLSEALTPSEVQPVKDEPKKDAVKDDSASRMRDAKAKGTRRRRVRASGQNQIVVLAGVVIGLLFLFYVASNLDFNSDERRRLANAVAGLKISKGYKAYQDVRERVESFGQDSTEPVDREKAESLLEDIDGKVNDAVETLVKEAQALARQDLEDRQLRSKAESIQSVIGAWKKADKSKLEKHERTLKEVIGQARSWSDFGEQLAEYAKKNHENPDLELHNLVAGDSKDEGDRDLAGDFAAKLKDASRRRVADVLALLASPRFHPVFESTEFETLKSRANQVLATRLTRERDEAARKFRKIMREHIPLRKNYSLVMRSAYSKLENGDLAGALAAVKASRYSSDIWFKKAADWLAGDLGRDYAESMKPQPENKPEVIAKKPDSEPEVMEPENQPDNTPAASEVEEQGTYKEKFVELLVQYKGAKSGERDILAGEMGKVMTDSLSLVKQSPAMAYDVVRFYRESKKKWSREAKLKDLFEAHVDAAFSTIFPTVTGPSGFRRLWDWCKDLKHKNGQVSLQPIMQRLTPIDNRNPVYNRQRALRKRRADVVTAVEGLVSKLRVHNVKSLRKLLGFLRLEGLKSEDIGKDFKLLTKRLIDEVGKDVRLAQQLNKSYDDLPERDLRERQREALLKKYKAKSDKIWKNAEKALIDAVVKALKAKEPGVGYDLLQQALVVNPQSERAYKGLKYKYVDGEWIRPWEANMRARGLKYNDAIGWHKGDIKDGEYYNLSSNSWENLKAANDAHRDAGNPWILKSEHFELRSTAPLSESQLVLRRLEAFYMQLFRQFDLFFAPNGNPVVVFGLATKKPMLVNYYHSRKQFQDSANPPTDWAAGFYSGGRHASFFYSTPGSWTVLQHEIVHQILGENSSGHADSWLAEGTAVYMEDAYFDSFKRLRLGPVGRHSRPFRYLMEARQGNPTISFDEILALRTGAQWGQGNIGDHYKGAGSVVYFFMTFDGGRYRGDFLDYLRNCYNRQSGDALPHYFGISTANLKWFFDRFYKQGFTTHNGRMMTHEEKMIFDQETIERLYPDPDPKNFKKKPAGKAKTPEFEGEVADLVKTLRSNPNMDRRKNAAAALASLGEAGKEALDLTLKELIGKVKDKIKKHLKSKRGSYRRHLAGEIIRRRQEAYDFIMDPSKYPDANHGKAAQPEVDKLVNALRDAIYNPWGALTKLDKGPLKGYMEDLDRYHGWREEFLGSAPDKKADHEEVKKFVNDTMKMDQFPVSKQDQGIRKANEEILAYNARAKTSMNKEELACCAKTNEYRMMFGLKALKYFDPLVKAARGHSQEMLKLKFFDHNSPTPANRTPKMRCEREGARYSGENIAMGHPNGEAAFWGWYNSSGHHRNILGKVHTSIGVGQAQRYWTQNFGRDNPK